MKQQLLFLLLQVIGIVTFAQTATVTLNQPAQYIHGFGGMNHPVWIGDLTAAQRETAFGNGPNQLGFQVLRIWVSDNPTQWQRELATAQRAIELGAIVFASPWNPPSHMIETFTRGSQTDAKRLRYDQYAAYAQHLNDFVTYMRNNGVDLYAISIQNEPDYAHDWTWWTTTEMLNFIKNHARSIDCRIIAPESFQYVKSVSDPILNDADALSKIDILGAHLYGTQYTNFAYPLFKQRGAGKELWMTEVYHPNSDANSADRWPEALETARNIHHAMADGEFQMYVWWYIRRQYSPMKEDGTISKRGYMMAHYSKFVRPGYYRVEATKQPATNVLLSAYKDGDDVVVVVINRNTSASNITISVPGTRVETWERHVTTGSKNLSKETNISAPSGSFQVTLEAESITTFVGKAEEIPVGTNLLTNGEFDNGTTGWDMQYNSSTAGTFTVVTNANMSGTNAARVCPTTPGTETWHVQLRQDVGFQEGKHYEISFIAKADAARTIGSAIQMEGDPWTTYWGEDQNLTTVNQTFTYTFSPTVSDAAAKLKFYLGTSSTCVLIDNVVFKEIESASPAPTVTTPVTYCQGATATALTATGTALRWYTTATGGQASTTAPIPSTATVGNTTHYVSQTVNGIESPRSAIVVTIHALPTATITASGNTSFCTGGNVTLNANTGTGLSYQWWRDETTAVGTGAASLPIYFSSGSYTVEVTNANNCKRTSSPVVVTVNPIPDAPTVVSPVLYQQGATATALMATGTGLQWYTTPTDGTGSTTAPIPSTAVVGSTLYYVSQTVNSCESERSVITVTIVEAETSKIQLQAGWNLIGSPLENSVSLEQALSSIWEYLEQIKDMDGFYLYTNEPPYNSLHEVQWGRGYFIKVSVPCELIW